MTILWARDAWDRAEVVMHLQDFISDSLRNSFQVEIFCRPIPGFTP